MARLNQKQTLLVIAGVTVLLCGASGGGVYWAQGLIEEEKVKIEAKEREIDAARQKIKKIPEVEKRVIILRENVAQHVNILPNHAQLNEFTRTVQKFAIKSGISIDRFVPVKGSTKGGAFQRFSYQYHFTANLWQFMQFMNFFESYERFVSVRDFSLTGGKAAKPGEDAVHAVRMTVETYVYEPGTTSALTKIDNLEAKRKLLLAQIAAGASLGMPEPYRFVGREGRRDIFVDPRQKDTGEETRVLDIERQRQIIDEFSGLVLSLGQKWARSNELTITMFERIELKGAVTAGLAQMKEKIEQVTAKKMITNPALNARWFKEVQQPYKALRDQVDTVEGQGANNYLSKENFERLATRLKDLLAEGELDAAVTTYNSWAQKLDVPRGDPRYPLRIKVEGLIMKAKLALEFSAIPLSIGGVLVNEEGKSGVILNGEVFEEGEYINDNLFVKAVRSEEVEFVYKGFTLLKTF